MVSILTVSDPRWTEFVASHPSATPFHDAGWISTVSGAYGFRAFAVALMNGSTIEAGLPIVEIGRGPRRRWVSLPFTDRCSPLTTGSGQKVDLAGQLAHVRRQRRLRSIELRDTLAERGGFAMPCGYWHELELAPDADTVYGRFNRLRRRLLRRAAEHEVVVEQGTSANDLCQVFFDLHVATRRRLGVPVQPRRLFELLWQRVIEPGGGIVFVARLSGAPIAAAVFLASHRRMTAKYSATDRNYATLGGMDAVYWNAMQWGCERGYQTFEFGRTEAENDGLRQFKRSWGAREVDLGYTIFAAQPPSGRSGKAQAALGEVIRRSPPWVAKAVGRIAYRFAA